MCPKHLLLAEGKLVPRPCFPCHCGRSHRAPHTLNKNKKKKEKKLVLLKKNFKKDLCRKRVLTPSLPKSFDFGPFFTDKIYCFFDEFQPKQKSNSSRGRHTPSSALSSC